MEVCRSSGMTLLSDLNGTKHNAFKNVTERKGYSCITVKGEWKVMKSGPMDEEMENQITRRLHTSSGVHFFL